MKKKDTRSYDYVRSILFRWFWAYCIDATAYNERKKEKTPRRIIVDVNNICSIGDCVFLVEIFVSARHKTQPKATFCSNDSTSIHASMQFKSQPMQHQITTLNAIKRLFSLSLSHLSIPNTIDRFLQMTQDLNNQIRLLTFFVVVVFVFLPH